MKIRFEKYLSDIALYSLEHSYYRHCFNLLINFGNHTPLLNSNDLVHLE